MPSPSDRPTTAANDCERETQVTEIITRLERVLSEAAKLREELERLNQDPAASVGRGRLDACDQRSDVRAEITQLVLDQLA